MMNGAKKSDSSIVPAKLANKAERSASESVEGDDGTKRNAELQSTVRTQSREAVTQAQASIRGAVAERFLIDLRERLAKFALSKDPPP
jgi:RNA-directed DNA polymerase